MADEHQTADAAAGTETSLRDELRSAVNELKDKRQRRCRQNWRDRGQART